MYSHYIRDFGAVDARGGVRVKFSASERGARDFFELQQGRGRVKFLKPTELDLHPPDVNYGTSLTIAVPG